MQIVSRWSSFVGEAFVSDIWPAGDHHADEFLWPEIFPAGRSICGQPVNVRLHFADGPPWDSHGSTLDRISWLIFARMVPLPLSARRLTFSQDRRLGGRRRTPPKTGGDGRSVSRRQRAVHVEYNQYPQSVVVVFRWCQKEPATAGKSRSIPA